MDEYIKREDAIKAITWNGLSEPPEIIHLTLLTAQKNIRRISTADVVPKSEVEKIFEDVESIIRNHDERPKYQLMLDLAELKKKYTEEKK